MIRQTIIALTEKFGLGFTGNLYCRTRFIDEALRDALERNISQVVILGAGFDARAYCIRDIEKVRVF